eukprot:gnl/MRDRNA2_/MRDRNA2_110329_c0_seq1.p1 gnl/MRDRNA2_/MRDRNA2_110329_c0~~gnl/MRDRNA2_/MRDRNA2_110329_c0_seq1.p1  ORF type:complete len:431 (+),score=95.60 gnl/MRDRNA2_/MRDRNA2_110329_c0_seq1:93-1385(+)
MAVAAQHMTQPLLENGTHSAREQNVTNRKTVGVFASGVLLGAAMGVGMTLLVVNPASLSAGSKRQSMRMYSAPEYYYHGPGQTDVSDDVGYMSADATLARDSQVAPVALRFDNTCFWKKQDQQLQQLLTKEYVTQQLQTRQAEVVETQSEATDPSTQTEAKATTGLRGRFLKAADSLKATDSHSRRLGQALLDMYAAGPATDANVHLAFQEHCQKWVAQTTDATWHSIHEADREAAVEKYFAPDFVSHIYGFSVGGRKGFHGRETLKTMIKNKLKVFPDLKIRILDTLCTPAVHDELGTLGFFTTMPDLSEGTMMNDMPMNLTQADGSIVELTIPASQKKVSYAGNAVTFVAWNDDSKNWQYQGEWVMHGEMEMYAQMNALHLIQPHAAGVGQKIVNDIVPKVEGCQMPHLWYGDVPVSGVRSNVVANSP